MRIDYERTGGFAGMRLAATIVDEAGQPIPEGGAVLARQRTK